jgi:hypothetical protein
MIHIYNKRDPKKKIEEIVTHRDTIHLLQPIAVDSIVSLSTSVLENSLVVENEAENSISVEREFVNKITDLKPIILSKYKKNKTKSKQPALKQPALCDGINAVNKGQDPLQGYVTPLGLYDGIGAISKGLYPLQGCVTPLGLRSILALKGRNNIVMGITHHIIMMGVTHHIINMDTTYQIKTSTWDNH